MSSDEERTTETGERSPAEGAIDSRWRRVWQSLKRGGARDDLHPNDQGTEAWFIVLTLPFILILIAALLFVCYHLF